MPARKPILIACPQYGVLVRGQYECGPEGAYLLGPDGSFDLRRCQCSQRGGRCMQTLCALHRFNRGGPGSWYPDRILAAPQRKRSPRRRAPAGPAPQATAGGICVQA